MTEDPRAVRSRALLHFAVRDILVSEGTAGLTVSALCRRAGLHRTTFYQHYEDMTACVSDAVVEPVADELAQAIEENPVPWAEGEVDAEELSTWGGKVRTRLAHHTDLLIAILARGNDVEILHELVLATARRLSHGEAIQTRMRLRSVVALTILTGMLDGSDLAR